MAGIGHQQVAFDDYEGFVNKFKGKKTTDDCYTPATVYDCVADYVTETDGIRREDMVRPFWPGGDYESYDYPEGCCVVDNPPFSIITAICKEYQMRKIRFFMFCPYLTAGGITKTKGTTLIVAPVSVRYENGAEISTCFVTNMEPENIIRGDSDLYDKLKAADDLNRSQVTKEIPKYEYPEHVLTVHKVGWFTIHHTPFTLRRSDCCIIAGMDTQRLTGKAIFGSGFLLCDNAAAERAAAERAAAERAAAERAAAHRWQLSDRERKMIEIMNKGQK